MIFAAQRETMFQYKLLDFYSKANYGFISQRNCTRNFQKNPTVQ